MSSVLTANSLDVLEASITMPRRGAWTADVLVTSDDVLADDVALTTFDGRLTLNGHVYRGSAFEASCRARIVGGKGKLREHVSAKGYQIVPALTVAQDILDEVGEELDPSSAAALGAILPHWPREETTAERALSALSDELGIEWRVTPLGLIWFGTDTFPDADVEGAVLEQDDRTGTVVLGVDVPTALPAITYDGKKVQTVTHSVSGDGCRTTLHFGGTDRVRETIARLVKSQLPASAYYGLYPAKVILQGGDGSLDLVPEDTSLPGLQRVPLWTGVPELELKVAPGARVLVMFAAGSPASPLGAIFESGTLLEYTLGGIKVSLGKGAPSGVATFLSMTPFMALVAAYTSSVAALMAQLGPFASACTGPTGDQKSSVSSATSAVAAAAAALGTGAPLPTNFSLVVDAA